MKAKLTNGQVVKLTQDDCGCVGIHDGIPHWLYMDGFDRTTNRELFNRPDYLAQIAFAKQERVRLQEKLRNLQRLNIAQLLPENEQERRLYC